MNDPVQVVLVLSIVLLTFIFIVIGVWLALVLREIRKTVQMLNQTIGHLENFTAKLNEPADFLSGMIKGLEKGVEVIDLIKKFFRRSAKDESDKSGKISSNR